MHSTYDRSHATRRPLLAFAAGAGLVYLSIVGCARHFEWTAFERQPTPMRTVDGQSVSLFQVPAAHVAELDRNCVACHVGAARRKVEGELRTGCVGRAAGRNPGSSLLRSGRNLRRKCRRGMRPRVLLGERA